MKEKKEKRALPVHKPCLLTSNAISNQLHFLNRTSLIKIQISTIPGQLYPVQQKQGTKQCQEFMSSSFWTEYLRSGNGMDEFEQCCGCAHRPFQGAQVL